MSRAYTTRRQQIVGALVTKLKTINGTGAFLTNLHSNVVGRLLFWDEVCLLYTSPSPRDVEESRMPSSA